MITAAPAPDAGVCKVANHLRCGMFRDAEWDTGFPFRPFKRQYKNVRFTA